MFISFSKFLSVSLHLSGLKLFPPILKSLSTRCKSTDAACIALQYFVLLSFVAVMLTHVLVIIINQSTITLCNFYYNYYYRRVFAYYYCYYIGSQAIYYYYYYYYTVSSNLYYYYYYYILLLPHVWCAYMYMYMYVLHNYLPLGVIREVQGLPITDNCLNRFK